MQSKSRLCLCVVPLPKGIALGRREFSLERRSLGAYYTSRDVADVLCSWAIRSGRERILEPSFGGCEFITSARNRLASLGAKGPLSQVYGADIDANAFAALSDRHPDAVAGNFRLGDFLGMTVHDLVKDRVDVVIGNPPYVRHHAISEDVFTRASRLRDAKIAHLPMQANLWAFFVIHASSFLKPDGRMALVLPSNYLYASYAEAIRIYIRQHFASVVEIEVSQHLFEHEGAAEKSVLVFCDQWNPDGTTSGRAERARVEGIAEVSSILNDINVRKTAPASFELLSAVPGTTTLGDICDVKIGTVLGDARFFVFDISRANAHRISMTKLRLVATKASIAQGLRLTFDDLANAFREGKKVAVLDTTRGEDESVRAYLSLMPEEKIRANATFKKRATWHQPFGDNDPTDALFTGMSHLFPRLTLNPDNVPCTNALYSLRFKNELGEAERLQLPLSIVSSFGQLSAEIEGRPYASGLLKHEPSDVRRILRINVDAKLSRVREAFEQTHSEMMAGNVGAARSIADDFFVAHGAFSGAEIVKFRTQITQKRMARVKNLANKRAAPYQ